MKEMLLKALQHVLARAARYYIVKTNPTVIGITGSVGKTSCRMIISQVLQKYLTKKVVYTSSKNFNSELGVVFSIFQIENYTPGIVNLAKIAGKIIWKAATAPKLYDVIVLEYGVDHPGDMNFLLDIAEPDYAIFTKLDKIHSCYFDSPNGIGDEKIKLIHAAKKKAYLNPKDEFLVGEYNKLEGEKSYFPEVKNYTLENREGKVVASFEVGDTYFEINIIGEENAVYTALGFDLLEDMDEKVFDYSVYLDLELQPGRFSFFEGKNNSILIDSSYNAGPESMKKMIENTFELQKQIFTDYKVILVLGEMRELGDATEVEHRKLKGVVLPADEIYLIGQEMNYLKEELENQGRVVTHGLKSREIGKQLKEFLENADQKYLVLFKGSQNTIFTEEALKQVLIFPEDKEKLVRQSPDWLEKKEAFFQRPLQNMDINL